MNKIFNFFRSLFNRPIKKYVHPNFQKFLNTIHQTEISTNNYKASKHYKKLLNNAYDVVLNELLNAIKNNPKKIENDYYIKISIPPNKIYTISNLVPNEHSPNIPITQFIQDVNTLFVDQGFQSYAEIYNVTIVLSEEKDTEINFVFPNYKTQNRFN